MRPRPPVGRSTPTNGSISARSQTPGAGKSAAGRQVPPRGFRVGHGSPREPATERLGPPRAPWPLFRYGPAGRPTRRRSWRAPSALRLLRPPWRPSWRGSPPPAQAGSLRPTGGNAYGLREPWSCSSSMARALTRGQSGRAGGGPGPGAPSACGRRRSRLAPRRRPLRRRLPRLGRGAPVHRPLRRHPRARSPWVTLPPERRLAIVSHASFRARLKGTSPHGPVPPLAPAATTRAPRGTRWNIAPACPGCSRHAKRCSGHRLWRP